MLCPEIRYITVVLFIQFFARKFIDVYALIAWRASLSLLYSAAPTATNFT